MAAASETQLQAIFERIHAARNFDFSLYKRATMQRRIDRRVTENKCKGYADYLKLLDRKPAEIDALVRCMLVKATSFFRDEDVWQELSSRVLPGLVADKRANEEVRVWCAGCATGEEPYSVAMLLAETLGPAVANFDVKIFGTDLDDHAISFARRATYSEAQVASVPEALRARWFIPGPEGYTVKKELRRMVVLGVNNLASDAPISRLDLLLCRNVFIYLDAPLQRRVLSRFYYALRRHGVVVLGKAELIPFASEIFQPVDVHSRIYRRDAEPVVPFAVQEKLMGLMESDALSRLDARGHDTATGELHREVSAALRVPFFVTGIDGTIVLWNAAAARLWTRTEADVLGRKLTALSLPGMSGDLIMDKTAAVREGRSEREMAEGTIGPTAKSAATQISVEVTPIRNHARATTALLYSALDVTALRLLEADHRRVHEALETTNEALQTANEELQSSNEELQTMNEELQSANEELQTTNEELQSTNEELETTNEELQSTNAELDATNRELNLRTDEMHVLSLNQRAIIRNLTAAIMVIDANGRLTTWNLSAERLLGLHERDAVGQVLWTLRVPALRRSFLVRVRATLGERRGLRDQLRYRLPSGEEGRARFTMVPVVEDGVARGAVMLFEDETRSAVIAPKVRSLREVRKAKRHTKTAAKAKPAAMQRGKR